MQPEYLPEKQLCYMYGLLVCGYGEEMCELGQSVDHYKYTVPSLHPREACNEIHGNALPFMLWNG